MKYMSPKAEILELELVSVIMTSDQLPIVSMPDDEASADVDFYSQVD
ncbi:MAG: hypothetical protein IJ002_05540 [Clostridia bacterium]|nr:hypothetical protein [Clostridia bacterium]